MSTLRRTEVLLTVTDTHIGISLMMARQFM